MSKEMDKAVAEGLGLKKTVYGYRIDKKSTGDAYGQYLSIYEWLPSTNLQQAVDHIVPVLNEMGYWIDLSTDSAPHTFGRIFCKVGHQSFAADHFHVMLGQGSLHSERMAWALCEMKKDEVCYY